MKPTVRYILFLLAALFAFTPLAGGWAGDRKKDDKNEFYQGNVVPLADILAKSKTQIDADAAPFLLVLQAEDGKLYPLIKNEGSCSTKTRSCSIARCGSRRIPTRLFCKSSRCSLEKEKLHDLYYWCDICTIKRYQAGICDCCGDLMVFREEPVKTP